MNTYTSKGEPGVKVDTSGLLAGNLEGSLLGLLGLEVTDRGSLLEGSLGLSGLLVKESSGLLSLLSDGEDGEGGGEQSRRSVGGHGVWGEGRGEKKKQIAAPKIKNRLSHLLSQHS